jgi:hypothetical protein
MRALAAASSDPRESEQTYLRLLALARELPYEELSGFFAEVERARSTALLRVASRREETTRVSGLKPLLTAETLGAVLGVSEAQIYRLAKGVLRSAAIEVGEGTLRFDPDRIERFIEVRRRGS